MAFKIRWLGTACFEIRMDDGKTVVIDPYLDDSVSSPFGSDQINGCDAVFLTHGHYDHVLDVEKLAKRFKPGIYCSREVAENLAVRQNLSPASFHIVTAGDVFENDGFKAEILPGVHVDFVSEYHRLTGGSLLTDFGDDMMTAIQKGLEISFGPAVRLPDQFETWMAQYPPGEQLNFVFDLGNGHRIYMAGSYPDPGLVNVAKESRASLMLLQVLPGKTLQGLEDQTAAFALASGAQVIVPQHHDPLFHGAAAADLTKLKHLIGKHSVDFMEMNPGRWYTFE